MFTIVVVLMGCQAWERDGRSLEPADPASADASDDGGGDGGGEQMPMFDVQGGGTGDGGGGPDESGPDDCAVWVATIRDFDAAHPDFQSYWGHEIYAGLVEPMLGPDGLPVYTGLLTSPPQMTSEAAFDQWYRDVPGVNEAFEVVLPLEPNGDVWTYDNQLFFPIDELGFGKSGTDDYGTQRNFHFTTQIESNFEYEPGQVFTFTGDDDLWMFVDGELVMDIGGLHQARTATVVMDDLGLVPGSSYKMAIFHAERRTTESTFRIDTNIECFVPPG